jgi:hypothetical protein
MKTLDFGFEIKALGPTGELEGFASTYGNVDRVGDVVMPGAFAKTLAESGGKVPILWSHMQSEPIGLAQLSDQPGKGLFLRGQLDLDVEIGRRAHSALRKGIARGLSIGYDTVKSTMKGGVRQLLELKLWEISVVTIPAYAEAVVTGVKSDVETSMTPELRMMCADLNAFAAEQSLRAVLSQVRALAINAGRK